MRFLAFLFATISLFATDFERSIVKVFHTGVDYDYLTPWRSPQQSMRGGSGFLTDSGLIATNAHVVENALFLQVKLACYPHRFTARVVAIGHDCDIALLKVEDPLFSRIAEPLHWSAQMPKKRDPVIICGFPVGGEHLAITYGRVARYEISTYVNQNTKLMLCQLDGLASPGSSGGPVIDEASGLVVGLVHQGSGHHQRITEMIPLNIIAHFFKGVNQGEYKGFFSVGLKWHSMESAALRRYYGVPPGQTGVVVTQVALNSPAEGRFEKGDVITSIDGHAVYNDGTYEFQQGQYLDILHLFKSARDGSALKIEAFRNGEQQVHELMVDYNLGAQPRVAPIEYGHPPSYYIHGGFVFQPLTRNYVNAFISQSSEAYYFLGRFHNYFEETREEKGNQEVVLLTRVLPGECNIGYHNLGGLVVKAVNGRPIHSMRDLIYAIETSEAEFLVIQGDDGQEIVVDGAECKAEGATLLSDHQIPADRSNDLIPSHKI